MMRFDGPTLARGWLAVATAAATDRNAPPAIYKTVMIEEYLHHVRLYATDRFVLLASTVADLDDKRAPSIDQVPERTVIVCDADGLARQLLGHVLALARRKDNEDIYQHGELEVSIDFDIRVPAGSSLDDQAIEGLEPTFAVLAVPDVERVYLPMVESPAPDWRPVFHSFAGEETKQITLNPELVERLGKVRRYAEGPLLWRFGGADRVALVEWPEADPHIEGAVTPRRDVNDKPPAEPPDTDEEPLPDEPPF